MIWMLLRREYIIKTQEQAVTSWTGFHHEVMEDRESPVYEVHHLSGINQSPTRFDTVQHMLTEVRQRLRFLI